MDIFNWQEFRQVYDAKQPTREASIKKAWKQWVHGHDSFEDKSTAEMEDYYNIFRSAWLIAEMFMK